MSTDMKSDRLTPATRRNEHRNVIGKWPADKHAEKTHNKHKLLSSGSSSLDGTYYLQYHALDFIYIVYTFQ